MLILEETMKLPKEFKESLKIICGECPSDYGLEDDDDKDCRVLNYSDCLHCWLGAIRKQEVK